MIGRRSLVVVERGSREIESETEIYGESKERGVRYPKEKIEQSTKRLISR